MKRFLLIITTAAAMFTIAGCEQFSTSYQRVDKREFRVLNIGFDPADAAPGDSVTLTAVFAGNTDGLDTENYLEWWISFNVIRDLFGSETVIDSVRLEKRSQPVKNEFSLNTRTAAFRFKVPDDIVRKSASIPDMWTDMLPPNLRDVVPADVAAMSKGRIVDAIEYWHVNMEPDPALPSLTHLNYISILLQFFTVPIRVSVKVNDPDARLPHTIRSSHSIRYNGSFNDGSPNALIPGLPVNYNPVIDSLVIFKVKGEDIANINDKTKFEYEAFRVDNAGSPAIIVEKGYSYFLDAIAENKDSALTLDDNWVVERHRVYRQFQLNGEEIKNVHHTDYLDVDNGTGRIIFGSKKIQNVIFWVTVEDESLNERLRPRGSALAEAVVRFEYR